MRQKVLVSEHIEGLEFQSAASGTAGGTLTSLIIYDAAKGVSLNTDKLRAYIADMKGGYGYTDGFVVFIESDFVGETAIGNQENTIRQQDNYVSNAKGKIFACKADIRQMEAQPICTTFTKEANKQWGDCPIASISNLRPLPLGEVEDGPYLQAITFLEAKVDA